MKNNDTMEINYGMEIVRATEIAALTAARQQGLGDQDEILNQTRAALATTLNRLQIDGRLVNDRFRKRPETRQLPDKLGKGGAVMDLMGVALEGHHAAAEGQGNVTSFAAIGPEGSITPVPNLNMQKIVVGPKAGQVIDINQPPTVNIKRVARALGKYTENVTVCILNQAWHQRLIREVRNSGARIKLIEEGEISGCLAAITGDKADIYIGQGYAPEGVMVAAAISCLGGYFEGRIYYGNDQDRREASEAGITTPDKVFRVEDLVVPRQVSFAATGITDGEFLEGVRFTSNGAITHSFVARAATRTYRHLTTRHFFDHKPVF
ncbi:MAG: fructose-bisphosphatase class II family protein [Thermodesulfobacteriota bacterium]